MSSSCPPPVKSVTPSHPRDVEYIPPQLSGQVSDAILTCVSPLKTQEDEKHTQSPSGVDLEDVGCFDGSVALLQMSFLCVCVCCPSIEQASLYG